ncbi:neocarzinostatin apoprotein domain-containing protein [Nocardia noduli]|uniref:neocarzinostatin apoprotein domain-containing protein n=1 Tax=Nocardia noduli TaxID=2815722 RepID=UPI001C210CE2|nr:neocarzinostatin apoprotein domain-containing protein [Nocardia noduli]
MTTSTRAALRRAVFAPLLAAGLVAAPAIGHAAPADTATLHVGTEDGVTEGQRITVRGSGFRPGLAAVAVGLCEQGYTNGLTDCDLEGGATFVNIGADGTFPELTLTARSKFRDIDCAQRQCVIAAAPLPGSEPESILAANSAVVLIGFAGTRFHGGTAQTPVAASTATVEDLSGPSTPLWFATAALLAIITGLALTIPANQRKIQEEK